MREIEFRRKGYEGERERGYINLGFCCLVCVDIVYDTWTQVGKDVALLTRW